MRKLIPIKAVLFDRDGTLNKDYGYVYNIIILNALKDQLIQ